MSLQMVPVIRMTEEDICELCGDVAELRPYGPNGERVCFSCGMKDEVACRRALDLRFDGVPQ